MKHIYLLLSTFLILVSVSCLPPITDNIDNTDDTLSLPVEISLRDITAIEINGKALEDSASATLDFNRLNESHRYSVYELPTTKLNSSSSKLINLTLNLNGYVAEDLNKKSFFLIASNSESIATPNQGIQGPLQSIRTIKNRPQFQRKRNRLAQTSSQNIFNTFDFDTAKEYDPDLNNLNDANKRSFLFEYNGSRECTTLYKKIDEEIKDQRIRIALWVDRDRGGNSTSSPCTDSDEYESNNLSIDDDMRIKDIFDRFEEDFFTSTDNIYSKIYQLNDDHYWGPHTNLYAFEEDAVLHIGFGDLDMDETAVSLGYIDPAQFFKPGFLSILNESIPSPTMYLSLDNLLRNPKTQETSEANFIDLSVEPQNLILFYSTFVHELEHIATIYFRGVKGTNSINAVVYGSPWFAELIAITTEHLLHKEIFSKIHANFEESKIDRMFLEDMLKNNRVYNEYNHNVFVNGITATNFNVDNYETSEIFASYLINNFGIEVFRNILHSNSIGQKLIYDEEAIFNAVSSSNTFYHDYATDVQPQSFAEIIHDFHISSFLSVPTQIKDRSIGPYKMYIYNYNVDGGENIDRLSLGNLVQTPSKNSDISLTTVSYNLASTPLNPIPGKLQRCFIDTTTRNCYNDNTYINISPENTGRINLNFNDTWFEGSGPVLTTLETTRRTLIDGKADFIFLGGKLNKSEPGQNVSFNQFTTADGNNFLQLRISLPSTYHTSLVVIEEFQ